MLFFIRKIVTPLVENHKLLTSIQNILASYYNR